MKFAESALLRMDYEEWHQGSRRRFASDWAGIGGWMSTQFTGSWGFLGARLARTLLGHRVLSLPDVGFQPIARIMFADEAQPPDGPTAAPRMRHVGSGLLALASTRELLASGMARRTASYAK